MGFIDYLRKSFADKVADVPEPQVRTPACPPAPISSGLVKHLIAVERFYFSKKPITNMRRTFRPARKETVHADIFREQIDGSTGR